MTEADDVKAVEKPGQAHAEAFDEASMSRFKQAEDVLGPAPCRRS